MRNATHRVTRPLCFMPGHVHLLCLRTRIMRFDVMLPPQETVTACTSDYALAHGCRTPFPNRAYIRPYTGTRVRVLFLEKKFFFFFLSSSSTFEKKNIYIRKSTSLRAPHRDLIDGKADAHRYIHIYIYYTRIHITITRITIHVMNLFIIYIYI